MRIVLHPVAGCMVAVFTSAENLECLGEGLEQPG